MYYLGVSLTLAVISLVGEDASIQVQHYNFIPISDVVKVEPKKTVDVLAIVVVGPALSFHPRPTSPSPPSRPAAVWR